MNYLLSIFTFKWVFVLGGIWTGVLFGACPYALLWYIKTILIELQEDTPRILKFIAEFGKDTSIYPFLPDLWKASEPLMYINIKINSLSRIFSDVSLLDLVRSLGVKDTIRLLFWAFGEINQIQIDQWEVYYHQNNIVDAGNREFIQQRLDRLINSQRTFSWIRDNPVYSYIWSSLSESSTARYLACLSIFGSALIVFVSLGVNPNGTDLIYI